MFPDRRIPRSPTKLHTSRRLAGGCQMDPHRRNQRPRTMQTNLMVLYFHFRSSIHYRLSSAQRLAPPSHHYPSSPSPNPTLRLARCSRFTLSKQWMPLDLISAMLLACKAANSLELRLTQLPQSSVPSHWPPRLSQQARHGPSRDITSFRSGAQIGRAHV